MSEKLSPDTVSKEFLLSALARAIGILESTSVPRDHTGTRVTFDRFMEDYKPLVEPGLVDAFRIHSSGCSIAIAQDGAVAMTSHYFSPSITDHYDRKGNLAPTAKVA